MRITDSPRATPDTLDSAGNNGEVSQLFDTADVVVRLRDRNEVPTFEPFVIDVPEISGKRTLIGEPLVNGAGDPDIYSRNKLAFTIVAGDPEGLFKISECDGQVSVGRALITEAEELASHEIDNCRRRNQGWGGVRGGVAGGCGR